VGTTTTTTGACSSVTTEGSLFEDAASEDFFDGGVCL